MQQNTVDKIVKVINQSIQNNDIYGASYSLIGKMKILEPMLDTREKTMTVFRYLLE